MPHIFRGLVDGLPVGFEDVFHPSNFGNPGYLAEVSVRSIIEDMLGLISLHLLRVVPSTCSCFTGILLDIGNDWGRF